MNHENTIVVLGGGVGGLTLVTELAKSVRGKHRIVLVDRKTVFHECVNNLWAITKDVPDYGAISVDFSASLRKAGVELIEAEVNSINPESKVVETEKESVRADYLVIALGAQLSPESVPGLADAGYNIYEWKGACDFGSALKSFENGKIGILVSRTPFKCPAAPYEAAFLLDSALREYGRRQRVQLDVYTPEWQPMLSAGDEVGNVIVGYMAERGIGYNTERFALKVDSKNSKMLFEIDDAEYDLLAFVPPHTAPQAVRSSGLTDSTGWVPVNPNTLETRYRGVYALGDISSIRLHNGLFLPMAGVFALGEALVVANNIAAQLGLCQNTQFSGEGFCFIEVGNRLAAMGSGNFYAAPSPKVSMTPPTNENWMAKRELASSITRSLKALESS